jgi:hypothetical protein
MALVSGGAPRRGRPFPKGVSGNPGGRPQGARGKATLRLEALIDSAGEALGIKLVEQALTGDMAAMRLCLQVMFPAGRKRGVEIALPPLETPGACMQALARVIDATATGEITLDEAKGLSDLIQGHHRNLTEAHSQARCSPVSDG